jgi:predicted NUDIX family NTP pyrophosphohydrolase
MYRYRAATPQVLLVHPGGPFWRNRDRAAWSIPKGELDGDEDPWHAAQRELYEETGLTLDSSASDLGRIRQSHNKELRVWAPENDCDPATITSNTFSLKWPPNSGRYQRFPEVDRAAWFNLDTAKDKLHKGQVPLVDRLCRTLGPRDDGHSG